ncbi:MAG: hypothetical protein IPJ65_41625 [Archangiaceae bacterium]|nr:hypothetical protein [Archangiaceae bacterium]
MRTSLAVLFLAAAGCGRSVAAPDPMLTTCTDCPTTFDDDALVVHEWGTFTSVMASDGTLLPGLHHEEEDLPGFVADRTAAASWPGADVYSNQKVETPVTYFYSPHKVEVSAKVEFPKGVLTQWFPWVKAVKPYLYWDGRDPWLSTNVTPASYCDVNYSQPFHDSLLDWKTFEVMEPGVSVPLAGPLGETNWGYARNTASNPLRVPGPEGYRQPDQYEKFLFYRGLGDFELPLHATVTDRSATFENRDAQAELGGLVLMRVTAEAAGFLEVGDLPASGTRASALPAANLSHAEFVAALKEKLRARLVASGLFTDEAQAMVDTWERAYFLTPGLRLLYLLPQARTDALLPLTLSPAPKALIRTMVIRVELMQPADERELAEHLTAMDSAYFLSHGRFAEPHLTRALQLVRSPESQAMATSLLETVRAKKRWAPLAAE